MIFLQAFVHISSPVVSLTCAFRKLFINNKYNVLLIIFLSFLINLQIIFMNKIKIILTALLFITSLVARSQSDDPKYNKALADSLGADDYGMKMYVLVMLKTGPVQENDKAKRDSLFMGHMNNIKNMASINKLVVAGPLQKNDKNYEGIFILNVKTVDEAKVLLEKDPAIKAGLLSTELYNWYGSAALPLYLPFYPTIEKKHF